MDATLNRSVDVGPTRARPGLALLLAVLSVPGTTMVRELDVPLPGFWIGLDRRLRGQLSRARSTSRARAA